MALNKLFGRKMAHLKTVKRDLSQGHQPRLLTRYQHLVEIEGQAKVPKRRRIVRAQANRNAMVQYRCDRVHRYRGGITLENGVIETIKVVSGRSDDDERPYQYLVPIKTYCSVGFVVYEQVNEMTDEIGQTSNAIFCSLHISMSLGCLIIENLQPQPQNEIRSSSRKQRKYAIRPHP